MRKIFYFCLVLYLIIVGQCVLAQLNYTFEVTNSQGEPLSDIVDGNIVRLSLNVDEPVQQAQRILFTLEPQGKELGECNIPINGSGCLSNEVSSLNWFWSLKESHLKAATSQEDILLSPIVEPRPVVLVHGFISTAFVWSSYLGNNGFLANAGLRGFAVGDGQTLGLMDMGNPFLPYSLTKTIAKNAEELAEYISGVMTLTGAEKVDLVAHSMGGLVSRYYLDEIMQEPNVTQLIMLGTPNGGSNCSNFQIYLRKYLPAALELTPFYIQNFFNQEITDRQDVPFFQIAGTPIEFGLSCTGLPNDSLVSLASITMLTTPFVKVPLFHMDLITSEETFTDLILERLMNVEPQQNLESLPEGSLDFRSSTDLPSQATQTFSGHVNPGGVKNVDVHLDEVATANFALFDPSHSLKVTMYGIDGRVIELSPDQHELIATGEPTTLVSMEHSLDNPDAGLWKVILAATEDTPLEGIDYMLSVELVGGAQLETSASPLLSELGESIELEATLELSKTLQDINITALIRRPGGSSMNILLQGSSSNTKSITWSPQQSGLYGIDIVAKAVTADGLVVERTDFLVVDVQPSSLAVSLIEN